MGSDKKRKINGGKEKRDRRLVRCGPARERIETVDMDVVRGRRRKERKHNSGKLRVQEEIKLGRAVRSGSTRRAARIWPRSRRELRHRGTGKGGEVTPVDTGRLVDCLRSVQGSSNRGGEPRKRNRVGCDSVSSM